MNRLFSVALLWLLVSPLRADAPLDCMTRATWGARGSTSDMEIDGTRLIVADGRGVAIYDVANPALIREAAVATTERPSIALQRAGTWIAVLTVSSIELFEERDGALRRADRATVTASNLAAGGSHIATGGDDATVFRIDSDGRLAVFSRIKLDTAAVDVGIDGSILYVAERDTGISVYEIGSEQVTKIGSIALAAKSILVGEGRLFAASGLFGVSIVDVSNPRAARILTTTTEGLADARVIERSGDVLWIDDAGQRLVAIRYDGTVWSTASTIDVAASAFAPTADRIFIAERPAGGIESGTAFQAFDVSASGVARAGEFRHDRGPLGGVALLGDLAYVADPPRLRVVDLRDPHRPREITSIDLGDSSDRVRIEGSLALVHGTGNVHLFDASDAASPRKLGVFRSLGIPRSGAAMAGNVLLECNRATGLHVVDISNPSAPRQTSGLRNDGYGQFLGVVAMPGVAYAFVTTGVKVVDVSNPNSARVARVISAPVVSDLEIAPANPHRAALLLLLDGDFLRVFDLRDPLAPSEISRIEVSPANDIAVDGETAVVTTPHGALLIIDLADPARPQIRRRLSGLSSPSQVAVRDGRIAVADRFALKLFRDPDVPVPDDEVVLKVRSDSTSRLALLSWTAIPDATYEVQFSETNDFAIAQSIVTGRSDHAFSLSRAMNVRVRVADPCTAGLWSNAVRVSPDERSAVDFVARGSHHIVPADGEAESISIGIRNDSGESRVAALTADPADGLTLGGEVSLAPGSNASTEILVDPKSIAGSREYALRIRDTESTPYRLKVTTVLATPADAPVAPGSLLIPAVGSTPGAAATMWRSDLHLYCDGEACPVEIRFRPYGAGRSGRAISLSLGGGEMVVIGDAIARLFGASREAGSLEIASPAIDSVRASAITYNDSRTGKFGERIPAIEVPASSAPKRRLLLGIAQNERARTNIGIIETSGRAEALRLTLMSSGGAAIASATVDLIPYASSQQTLTSLFPDLGDLAGASIAVDGSESVIAYASRVDQKSGDSTFAYAVPASADEARLDVVGLTRGAEGTFWRTALQVTNASASPETLVLELISADGSATIAKRIAIPANGSLATEDLITDHFAGADPGLTAAASLRIRSDAPFVLWGRIYNDHAAGTYGQSIAPRMRDLPAPTRLQILPLYDGNDSRSNVGFGEMSGLRAHATLRFYDGAGSLLAVEERSLAPHESTTLLGVLRAHGLDGSSPVRLEIETDGNLFAYGSVVERANGDAVFIPGR